MSGRVLTVVLGDNWAEFSGHGSRELYVELRGRPPVYNTRTRRWTAQLQTARDLVALAESRRWSVTVVGGHDGHDLAGPEVLEPEPEASLW
jgi:hypothetical protein